MLDLGDPGAGPETAGGKGSSLARLTRAGFRVPPGFHVTTSAYLDFIGRDGLREQLLSAASEGSPAARVGDLFADRSLPAATRRFVSLLSPVGGRLPPAEEIPRPRLPRVKVMAKRVPVLAVILEGAIAVHPATLADAFHVAFW